MKPPNRDVLAPISRGNQQAIRFLEDLSGQVRALSPGEVGAVSTVVLASDVANSLSDTLTDVTGLSFGVMAGRSYWFRAVIDYTAAAATTGSRWSVSGPAATRLSYGSNYPLTGATEVMNRGLAAYGLPAASSASSASAAANIATVEGFVTPSVDGTITISFASEIGGSAITAKAGSVLQWARVL